MIRHTFRGFCIIVYRNQSTYVIPCCFIKSSKLLTFVYIYTRKLYSSFDYKITFMNSQHTYTKNTKINLKYVIIVFAKPNQILEYILCISLTCPKTKLLAQFFIEKTIPSSEKPVLAFLLALSIHITSKQSI